MWAVGTAEKCRKTRREKQGWLNLAMVSVVEGPGLEGLELGGTEGTPSLQSSQNQEWEMLERLCVATGWVGGHKLPGAAREESSGTAITNKGVSSFPVKVSSFPQQTAAFQSRALLSLWSRKRKKSLMQRSGEPWRAWSSQNLVWVSSERSHNVLCCWRCGNPWHPCCGMVCDEMWGLRGGRQGTGETAGAMLRWEWAGNLGSFILGKVKVLGGWGTRLA